MYLFFQQNYERKINAKNIAKKLNYL